MSQNVASVALIVVSLKALSVIYSLPVIFMYHLDTDRTTTCFTSIEAEGED